MQPHLPQHVGSGAPQQGSCHQSLDWHLGLIFRSRGLKTYPGRVREAVPRPTFSPPWSLSLRPMHRASLQAESPICLCRPLPRAGLASRPTHGRMRQLLLLAGLQPLHQQPTACAARHTPTSLPEQKRPEAAAPERPAWPSLASGHLGLGRSHHSLVRTRCAWTAHVNNVVLLNSCFPSGSLEFS